MKTMPPRTLWFLLATTLASALSAAESAPARSASAPAPLPRARLDRSTDVPVVRVDPAPVSMASRGNGSASVLTLAPVNVTDTKLVGPPQMPAAPDPKTFSLAEGGALYRGKLGSLPVAVGVWRYTDIFAEEERFQSEAPNKMLFDLVRIKF